MCTSHFRRNPIHCIVPPFMVERIVAASDTRKKLFAGSIHTRFNDELFRKKRSLLTEMNTKQMNEVMTIAGKMLQTAVPGKKTKTLPVPQPLRKIYDAGNSDDERSLPGKLARKDVQSPGKDKDVNNLNDNCG